MMEKQGQTYDSMMSIPYSRRKRFIIKKSEIEKTAANRQSGKSGFKSRRRR